MSAPVLKLSKPPQGTSFPGVTCGHSHYLKKSESASAKPLSAIKPTIALREVSPGNPIQLSEVYSVGAIRTGFIRSRIDGTEQGTCAERSLSHYLPKSAIDPIKRVVDAATYYAAFGSPTPHFTSAWEQHNLDIDDLLMTMVSAQLDNLNITTDQLKKFLDEGNHVILELVSHSDVMRQNMASRLKELLVARWGLSEEQAAHIESANVQHGACHTGITSANELTQKLARSNKATLGFSLSVDSMTLGFNKRDLLTGAEDRHQGISARKPAASAANTYSSKVLALPNGTMPSKAADEEAKVKNLSKDEIAKAAKLGVAQMAFYQTTYGKAMVSKIQNHDGETISAQDDTVPLAKLLVQDQGRFMTGYEALTPFNMTGTGDGATCQLQANEQAVQWFNKNAEDSQKPLLPKAEIKMTTEGVVSGEAATYMPPLIAGALVEEGRKINLTNIATIEHAPFDSICVYGHAEARLRAIHLPSYLANIAPPISKSIHPIAPTNGFYIQAAQQALTEEGLLHVVSRDQLPANLEIKAGAKISETSEVVKPFAEFVEEQYNEPIKKAKHEYHIESAWGNPAEKHFSCEARIAAEIAQQEGKTLGDKPPKIFDLEKAIRLSQLENERNALAADKQVERAALTQEIQTEFNRGFDHASRTVNDANTKTFIKLRQLIWERAALKSATKEMWIINSKVDAVATAVAGVPNLGGGTLFAKVSEDKLQAFRDMRGMPHSTN